MKGYKAFNKNMKCQGFQFEEGKIYKEKEAKCCKTGFHFCENPLDILNYYDLCNNVFHEVEALGKVDGNSADTKKATTEIKIGARLSLKGLIEASVDFLMKKCKPNKKDYAQLASSGYYAQLASSGYFAQLEVNGEYSVGAGIGINNIIKGKKGNWITLAEWEYKDNKHKPVCVKSTKIDGKKLKEDTFYKLEKGKFVEVK